MKIYIVHPHYDYEIDEVFKTLALAERYVKNLDTPDSYYIAEYEVLDYVPKGGNRIERFEKHKE